jgi:hypothetical protein
MKTKKSHLLAASIGVLLIVGASVGYFVGRARASGIPATQALTYSGTLTDAAGTPLTGQKNIQLLLYNVATGGTPACSTTPMSVTLIGGAFQITLPDTCTTQVQTGPDWWLDVVVDGGSLGRTKLGVVPFAIEAFESSCGPTTGAVMVDTGAGFCIDGVDRPAETAYGSAIASCAQEGKMLCSYAQLCTARIRNAGGIGLTTGYRVVDLLSYTDGHSYLGSLGMGTNTNSVVLPGACNTISSPLVPNGTMITSYRCCRGKG